MQVVTTSSVFLVTKRGYIKLLVAESEMTAAMHEFVTLFDAGVFPDLQEKSVEMFDLSVSTSAAYVCLDTVYLSEGYHYSREIIRIVATPEMKDFIYKFDEGCYPDLVWNDEWAS